MVFTANLSSRNTLSRPRLMNLTAAFISYDLKTLVLTRQPFESSSQKNKVQESLNNIPRCRVGNV